MLYRRVIVDLTVMRLACTALGVALSVAGFGPAHARALLLPFDYSQRAIGLDVTVKGVPL